MTYNFVLRKISHEMTYDFRKLKNERERRMLTKTELSAMSGVSIGTISRIESGEGSTWTKAIRKLRDALELESVVPESRRKKSA